MGTHSCTVGLDIGGTTMTAVVVNDRGEIVGRAAGPSHAQAGSDVLLDRAADVVLAATAERSIDWVGVGAAGVIDARRGEVISATEAIAGWCGVNVARALSTRLGGRPVRVRNDVHAFAIGEAVRGAGVGFASVAAVTIGTGIGGAFVVGGTLIEGGRQAAGHVGHMPVGGAEGRPCPCGRSGHLEAVASGTGIRRAYAQATGDTETVKVIADRAQNGDAVAAALFREAGRALGTVLAGIAAAVDPDVIVIGGGVWRAGAILHEPVMEAFSTTALPLIADTPIVSARLGDDAVALGAIESFRIRNGDGI